MSEHAISVRNLTKSFDGKTVLDGIDLDIPAGEVTLLMGENGSGKTILLSCLADGLHPTGGSISVFGSSADDARSNMSFMLQGGLLFSDLSGRANGEFYADLHPHGTDDWEEIAERFDIVGQPRRPCQRLLGRDGTQTRTRHHLRRGRAVVSPRRTDGGTRPFGHRPRPRAHRGTPP